MVLYKRVGRFVLNFAIEIMLAMYVFASYAWLLYNLLQDHPSGASLINFIISDLALMVLIALVFLKFFLKNSLEIYEGLSDQERKNVHKISRRMGKVIFSLLKEKNGWIGNLCRKWEDAK